MSISRREFLRTAGVATMTMSLSRLTWTEVAWAQSGSPAPASPDAPDYHGWQDVYRRRWAWDKVAKGTHHTNCWYQRGCTFNVFVKDGLVLREEQAGNYPQINPEVPDFNPRGCQKGACYSDRMYDPGRIQYPLKRVGERGEGKWKRVSWDEALNGIADQVIDVLQKDGPGAIYWDMGGGSTSGGGGVGLSRTGRLLDTISLDIDSEVGDHHPGAAVTCGKMMFVSSADDCFYSDLILIWGGNPSYTQIPNAHFINEARYKGARIVAITPDLNASAIHADAWVPVNVGSDAALGLSLSQVVVEENIYDAEFVREQTDLPLLIRKDTRRFLRASDLEADGEQDGFFVYDLESRSIRPAPKRTLAWDGIEPALEGEYTVNTTQGQVTVTPAFGVLRAHLQGYTPEATASITGTQPDVVRSLARQIAKAKSATVLTQSNFAKFYHGMEMERVQFLIFALCGQFGKKGSGVNAFPMLSLDGPGAASFAPADAPDFRRPGPGLDDIPSWERAKRDGKTTELMLLEMMRQGYKGGGYISSVLLFHLFGGLAPLTGSAKRWDPHLKRDGEAHLAEAFEKGWQIAPQGEPRILFEVGGNVLRRVRGYDRLVEGFLPKLSLMVTVDWRLSHTALYSDYVLPAAGWYERDDVIWATPLAPFAQATTKAVEPLGESKPDWEFHCLLLKALQERAIERELETFADRSGGERRLDRVYEDFTFNRRYTEKNEEELLGAVLEANTNLKGTTWESLKKEGHARFTGLGPTISNATDVKPNETITACTWHTEHKMPWPTLTRRMQFYIDHDLYFELGEELPVHKDNPPIGGDYPLQMTGGHARWSIHAAWRDSPLLLKLQQGEPVMYVSQQDARTRGIDDGDRVQVRNDVGSFEIRVKVAPVIRPGQVVIYHAWEPFQFSEHKSYQVTTPTPMNPIQMAGGYTHLQPRGAVGQPGMNDRGVRVEMEKLAPS
jgi:DMSO reductase family type II enzyme molybdopterin subunit